MRQDLQTLLQNILGNPGLKVILDVPTLFYSFAVWTSCFKDVKPCIFLSLFCSPKVQQGILKYHQTNILKQKETPTGNKVCTEEYILDPDVLYHVLDPA